MVTKGQRLLIEIWADNLTKEQMQIALVELVEYGIESEMISFSKAPYWSNCGEPLVKGQKAFEDE